MYELVVKWSALSVLGVVTLEEFIAFVKGGDNKGADSKASGDIQVAGLDKDKLGCGKSDLFRPLV